MRSKESKISDLRVGISFGLNIFDSQLKVTHNYIKELLELGAKKSLLRRETDRLWTICEGVAALIEMIDEDFHNNA